MYKQFNVAKILQITNKFYIIKKNKKMYHNKNAITNICGVKK